MPMTAPFLAAGWAVCSVRASDRFIASSFVAQRLRGIDGGGAPCGAISGEQADDPEHAGRGEPDGGGEGRLAEELERLVSFGGDEAHPDDGRRGDDEPEETGRHRRGGG